MDEFTTSYQEFARIVGETADQGYVLQLYIAGSSLRSQQAVANIKRLCNKYLDKECELQVIDIFQQPSLAKSAQVFAVPMLIKQRPNPKRLFIGDLSDTEAILASLQA